MSEDTIIGRYTVEWPQDHRDGSSKVDGVITPLDGAEYPHHTIFQFSAWGPGGFGRMWMLMGSKEDYPKYLTDAIGDRARNG